MPVKEGDKVKVEYTGTLEDGTVFDTSEGKEPLEFEVGAKQVIPGFEEAVKGMEQGEEKEVTLPKEEAYGEHHEQLVKQVPKEQVPEGMELKEGAMLGVTLPDGRQIPAKILEVGDKEVKIDLNHPLAGKTLKFKIKVVEIKQKEE